MINYGRQLIEQDDIDAVVAVLRGDWLTQGPVVEAFERALAEKVHARHVVAFSNGTAALHGACAAAGLGPGDRVAVPALTFAATANAARYVGATPVIVDIGRHTWNIDLDLVPDDVDALIAVHYAGLPVGLESMRRRPRIVIEDAAHALGAHGASGPVGNCAHSDMVCFSFHPVKPITTGEGGAVATNDDELAARLRRFRSHGIVRTPERGDWAYDVVELGYNYRLTDIQCALGLSQLRKLDRFIEVRERQAQRYQRELPTALLTLPPEPAGVVHGRHLFPVLVPERRRVFDELRSAGIGVQVHYVPLHHHQTFRSIETVPAQLPVVEDIYRSLISIPLHPGLSDREQTTVISTLTDSLSMIVDNVAKADAT